MTYHILRMPRRPQYAAIEDEPDGFDDFFMVNKGESCRGQIQGTLGLSLTRRHKGTKLDDFIPNLSGWPIVSEPLKDILAAECGNLEIYPVAIVDQKGKPVKAKYYLAHPVGTVDCVDLEKSKFDRDAAFPDKVLTFDKLVLREECIPEDLNFFRIKEYPRVIIIRADLAQKLKDAKIGGYELWNLGVPILL